MDGREMFIALEVGGIAGGSSREVSAPGACGWLVGFSCMYFFG